MFVRGEIELDPTYLPLDVRIDFKRLAAEGMGDDSDEAFNIVLNLGLMAMNRYLPNPLPMTKGAIEDHAVLLEKFFDYAEIGGYCSTSPKYKSGLEFEDYFLRLSKDYGVKNPLE